MAKPVSEEELQLKKRARRRLIGAIALVAAVAAVLPMVLDSEPKPTSKDINVQIPSPDTKSAFPSGSKSVPTRPETAAPAKSEKKAADATTAKPLAAEKPAPAIMDNPNDAALTPRLTRDKAAVPAQPAAKALEKSAEKAPAKAAEKTPDKAAEKTTVPKAGPGAFFIQVVALSEPDKAQQVQRQIVGAGVRSYTEVVPAGAGKVTRVRAGPFATRDEAEKAQTKLQGIGLEGKVAAY